MSGKRKTRRGSFVSRLRSLFGDRKEAAPAATPGPAVRSPVDEAFRPAAWVVREAFDRAMVRVEAADQAKESLGEAFAGAVRDGDAEAEAAVVVAHLAGRPWRWAEFEHWDGIFGARGEWPEGWRRFPSLLAPHRALPQRLEEALPYFNYLELRDLLGARRSASRPVPIRVEDLELAVLEEVAWDEVAPLAVEKYRRYQERCAAGRDEDLCRLLARHLRATCDNLVPYYQGLLVRDHELLRYRWEVVAPTGDPVAGDLAARFNRGESEAIPPYFPGDASRLQLRRL